MKTSIHIQEANKKFGDKTALSNVHLEIQNSGVTAILGKNGAGKTTLIRCCLGLETLDSGTIHFLGNSAGTKKAKQHIGAMLQENQLPESLTVMELITLFDAYYVQPLSVDEIIALSQTEAILMQREPLLIR